MDYLNSLHVDHLVMETRNRPLEELEVFKELDERIGLGLGLGLGVIDIKSNVVETANEGARPSVQLRLPQCSAMKNDRCSQMESLCGALAVLTCCFMEVHGYWQ